MKLFAFAMIKQLKDVKLHYQPKDFGLCVAQVMLYSVLDSLFITLSLMVESTVLRKAEGPIPFPTHSLEFRLN